VSPTVTLRGSGFGVVRGTHAKALCGDAGFLNRSSGFSETNLVGLPQPTMSAFLLLDYETSVGGWGSFHKRL